MCIAGTTVCGSIETKVLSRACCRSVMLMLCKEVVTLTVISRGGQTTEELLS